MHKLSRPWHGPYRVIERRDPDVTVVKVYAPQDGQIQVHRMRVAPCPPELPAGFYWYGSRRSSPGRPPKWVNQLLNGDLFEEPGPATESENPPDEVEQDREPMMDVLTDTRREKHECEVTAHADPTEEAATEDVHTPPDVSLPPEKDKVVGPMQEPPDSDLGDGIKRQKSGSHKPDESNLPLSCPQRPKKYNLRQKRMPPKRLMTVILRTSFLRGGDDVKQ